MYKSVLADFGLIADLYRIANFKSYNEPRWLEIKDYIKKTTKNYIIIDDFNLERFDKASSCKDKKHSGITAKLKEVCAYKLNSVNKNNTTSLS